MTKVKQLKQGANYPIQEVNAAKIAFAQLRRYKVVKNPCPECGCELKEKMSGVVCSNTKCDYWFCF